MQADRSRSCDASCVDRLIVGAVVGSQIEQGQCGQGDAAGVMRPGRCGQRDAAKAKRLGRCGEGDATRAMRSGRCGPHAANLCKNRSKIGPWSDPAAPKIEPKSMPGPSQDPPWRPGASR